MASHPVTVYRWDDPGAPQLPNGKPSEIIDILTKCLVDGYGDKTPLGWTRPFYDATNQAVAFRNSVAAGGSGGYERIWSNTNNDANNALMRCCSAASMVDINTMLHPGFSQAFSAMSGSGAHKRDKWMLIGTATAVYFIIGKADGLIAEIASYPLATIFFGDMYSSVPNDAGRFISIVSPTSADFASTGYRLSLDDLSISHSFNPSTTCLRIYDADGYDNGVNHNLSCLFSTANQSTSSIFNDAPDVSQITSNVLIKISSQTSDTLSLDRLSQPLMLSEVSPVFRGVMPGLIQMLHIGYRSLPWPSSVGVDGEQHNILRNMANGAASFAINLECWRDPFNPV